jgi:hypothetical protein
MPPPGPCLSALSSQGLRLGPSTALEELSHEVQQQTIVNAITLSVSPW